MRHAHLAPELGPRALELDVRGLGRRPRPTILTARALALAVTANHSPKLQGPSSLNRRLRILLHGPWSVAFATPMKLLTILSTHPSTKARSQAAGGSLGGIGVGLEGDRSGGKGQVTRYSTPKQKRPRQSLTFHQLRALVKRRGSILGGLEVALGPWTRC